MTESKHCWREVDFADYDYNHESDFDTGRYFLLRCANLHATKKKISDPYPVVFVEYPNSLSEEIRDMNYRYPMEPVTHYMEIFDPVPGERK